MTFDREKFPVLFSVLTPKWKAVLENSDDIADYIQEHSPHEVDHERIASEYAGLRAVLKKVPIKSLKLGSPEHNLPDPKREKKYLKKAPESMPPLVVEDGVILDGNHRLRVAKKLGLTDIWAYVIEEAS
jgi:hypothetical protein